MVKSNDRKQGSPAGANPFKKEGVLQGEGPQATGVEAALPGGIPDRGNFVPNYSDLGRMLAVGPPKSRDRLHAIENALEVMEREMGTIVDDSGQDWPLLSDIVRWRETLNSLLR